MLGLGESCNSDHFEEESFRGRHCGRKYMKGCVSITDRLNVGKM